MIPIDAFLSSAPRLPPALLLYPIINTILLDKSRMSQYIEIATTLNASFFEGAFFDKRTQSVLPCTILVTTPCSARFTATALSGTRGTREGRSRGSHPHGRR